MNDQQRSPQVRPRMHVGTWNLWYVTGDTYAASINFTVELGRHDSEADARFAMKRLVDDLRTEYHT